MNVMKHELLTLEAEPDLKNEEAPVDEDLFYSPSNIRYLEKVTAEIDSGRAKLSEHELIEA